LCKLANTNRLVTSYFGLIFDAKPINQLIMSMISKLVSETPNSKTNLFIILLSLVSVLGYSQNEQNVDALIKSVSEYFSAPRELVYTHLNKSVYIKGETLAFNAYVFDKNDKGLSKLTTNLYCTISDDNGKTIKGKLLKVTDGVTNGSFFIDSLFVSGNYTFKAYTNYMRNFDEQNSYIQSIKVIDPEIESNVYPKVITSILDAQFLPEGGHLVANVENTIGVIIKDSLGFGVPNIRGQVLNSKSEEVNVFETNQFGIGRFNYTPKDQNLYRVRLYVEGNNQVFILPQAEFDGIALSLSNINKNVKLRLQTNTKTFPKIKDKSYRLTIHNGKNLNIINIGFENDPVIIKSINYDDLFPGVNILTLFNENDKPLLERLIFKYDGINLLNTDNVTYKKLNDSTEVSLSFKDIDKRLINKISISILPAETKSYNQHQNIISSLYLQPYVNSYIENASWYFTEVNRRKQYDLDNLLLTQGWSSYDWSTIFNHSPKAIYDFETGVSFKATANNMDSGQFVIYPTTFNEMETFEINNDSNSFEKNGLFPFDEEKIRISEINKNDRVKKSGVYLQFYPSKIPDLEKHPKILPLKEQVYFDSNSSQPFIESSSAEYEQLDEVLIEVKKEQERIEKLQNTTLGNVDVFDSRKRRMYIDLATYLRTKGYTISQSVASFNIVDNRPNSFRSMTSTPLIFLNNRRINDKSELSFFDMNLVDYIIVNRRGYGEGLNGGNGVIKIFTDPTLMYKDNPQLSNFQEIEIPLTFTAPTKFYAPKYNYYQSKFFKEYGVIEWLPDMSVDENGIISFKISNQSGPNIILFIEGTANNGSFISEATTITIN